MVNCTRRVKLWYGGLSTFIYSTAVAYYVMSSLYLSASGWASTTVMALFYTVFVFSTNRESGTNTNSPRRLIGGAPNQKTSLLTMTSQHWNTWLTASAFNVGFLSLWATFLYLWAALRNDGLDVTSVFLSAIAFTMALKWGVTVHIEMKKQS
eukprot:PhF_6_TR28952/c0_g1_i1/m.42232